MRELRTRELGRALRARVQERGELVLFLVSMSMFVNGVCRIKCNKN